MRIDGSVALVTGAGRGLGRAITRELLERGARSVHGGIRRPGAPVEPGVTPVLLDVTDPAQIAAAAARLRDVTIVVNNAGVASGGRPLSLSLDDARRDLEVNYLGSLAMAQAFAPVLAANRGGALVNVLSVLSWVTAPPVSSYAAAKAAAWSMTNALRLQLRSQGTLVVAVYSDSIETDLTAGLPGPKHRPADVARAVLDGLERGQEEVLVDEHTRMVKASLPDDLRLLYPRQP